MSAQLFPDDIRFAQRLFRSAKCYSGSFTGAWDGATDLAESTFLQRCDAIAAQIRSFDERSERWLRTLHPAAQEAARRFLVRARTGGVDVRIISGTRSYDEQDRLYRIGRDGDIRKIVTRSRGGESNHNFGIAWDIGLFESGAYVTSARKYAAIAAVAASPDMEWGGAWKTFKDPSHFQLAVPLSLTEVRRRFEAGETFV